MDSIADLKTELANFLGVFEPYAKKYFAQKIKSTAKYSPIISKFYEDLADFSSRGKKLRAFLVWLGYQIGKFQISLSTRNSLKASNVKFQMSNESRKILPISLAFEMTQSFFLIHDDIIDHAPLRRGKPTIHKMYAKKYGRDYGQSMAIILGDIACVELFDLVAKSDFDPRIKVEAATKLAQILLETAYGQTLDIHNAHVDPTLAQIYKVTDLKSARYSFVGPLTLGATLAKVSTTQMKALEEFGANVGLAFQLQDDILGVFGDEKILGKSILSDMREGKNTILIHKTRELIRGTKRQRDPFRKRSEANEETKSIERIWGNPKATVGDLEVIKKIIIASGARQWCRQENLRLAKESKKYIDKITKNEMLAQILSQIADFVISRAK